MTIDVNITEHHTDLSPGQEDRWQLREFMTLSHYCSMKLCVLISPKRHEGGVIAN